MTEKRTVPQLRRGNAEPNEVRLSRFKNQSFPVTNVYVG